MTVLVGAHISNVRPLEGAEARKADLIQMFLSNPQSWKKPSPRDDAEELRRSPIPIYVHSPYLVNVVADNNRVRIPSRKILQETCDAATDIGAAAVIVHGGHVTGEEADHDEAHPRWRKALEQLDSETRVLIENTAGGDNAVVRTVDGLRRLWEEIGDLGPGFVLDTCHAWSGGEPLESLVERVTDAIGGIDLVHCNDSRDPFGSRRDRHANLGQGQIPEDEMVAILRSAGAPIVVETPGGIEEQAADIEWIRARVR